MSDVEAMLSWLRGVLDAEERKAQTAATRDPDELPGDHWTYDGSVAQVVDEQGRIVLAGGSYGGTWLDDARGGHIAHQDPAHVLAVVAAHRKILDAYADALANDEGYVRIGGWASCSDECAMAVLGEVVKVIASAHADHDGYRPEWGQS